MKNSMPQNAELHYQIKQKCRKFIDQYLEEDLKESFQEYYHVDEENFLDADYPNESQIFQYPDIFLLFGKTLNGRRVLNVIKEKVQLTEEEKKVLDEWQEKAFSAIFEIRKIGGHEIILYDITGEVEYQVFCNSEKTFEEIMPDIKPGYFFLTNLVPVHGIWFLSGAQIPFPPEAEEKLYLDFVQKQGPKEMYRNNPEKLALGFDLNKKEYEKFKEFFGTDTVILKGKEVKKELQKYYEFCMKKIGKNFPMPQLDLPQSVLECEDVGIVMDEKHGQHFFLHFGEFHDIFTNCRLGQDAKDFVQEYLEEESIPGFLFERMKRNHPGNYKKIMEKMDLSTKINGYKDPVKDFAALMDYYKPEWKEIYPSVHPINENLKKYLYKEHKIDRNSPCPCESGKKFKKCCGK